jgi:predicted thioesterase
MMQHQKIETNITDPDTQSMNLEMGKLDVLKTPFFIQKI